MALTKVTSGMVNPDPSDADNLSSGSVPAARLGNVDTSAITANSDDIALLGFRVASNGSLAKYNLVDQTVDDFQDTSGVDASSSAAEVRDSSGKYYSGQAAGTDPTGGTETTVGDYKYHSFTSTGANNFIVSSSGTVEALVIAGGAGGGAHHGGGGGAGAAANDTALAVTAQTYALSVGVQGAASPSGGYGGTGGDSTGFGWTLKGGGGGADYPNRTGAAGGCGGGGAGDASGAGGTSNQSSYTQSSGTRTVYESDGGSRSTGATGGFGGGIGASDDDARTFSNFSQFGVSGTFGGGGGCGNNGPAGTGGGGGAGAGGGNSQNGTAATPQNTGSGGGGGGGGGDSFLGAAGASGWIGVRYATTAFLPACSNMTLISTTTAAQAAPTKGDVVFTYTNGAGTTTLGTDVTAEISADGGSTWTAMTLGSEGSTGSHNIATAHDVTITSTITSPWNMAYRIKTLNQGTSKSTRIQAVSLGWS